MLRSCRCLSRGGERTQDVAFSRLRIWWTIDVMKLGSTRFDPVSVQHSFESEVLGAGSDAQGRRSSAVERTADQAASVVVRAFTRDRFRPGHPDQALGASALARNSVDRCVPWWTHRVGDRTSRDRMRTGTDHERCRTDRARSRSSHSRSHNRQSGSARHAHLH